MNISGFTLWDSDLSTPRHTFHTDTVLNPYEPIVVFGGGTVSGFFGIQVQVASNDDVGMQWGLDLDADNDHVILMNNLGSPIFEVEYDSNEDSIDDQSLTRFPDLSGSFLGHGSAEGSIGAFSPGTRVNGEPFGAPVPIPGAAWLLGSGLISLGGFSRKFKG